VFVPFIYLHAIFDDFKLVIHVLITYC